MTAADDSPFGAREAGPGLLLADPPSFEIEPRTSGHGEAGAQTGGKPRGTWYHTIEFPDGTITDGFYDHRPLVPHYGLPDDLAGRRALDVGRGDGFWAFQLERRGAEVTALDIAGENDRDLPPELQPRGEGPGSSRYRFAEAHDRMGSAVHGVTGSVYDLDPERFDPFDLVHCGDLLIHLERPLDALRRLRSVTRGQALLADVVNFHPGQVVEYLGGWQAGSWWRPSVGALAQMIHDAGFGQVEVRCVYRLDMRGHPGPWRALIDARP